MEQNETDNVETVVADVQPSDVDNTNEVEIISNEPENSSEVIEATVIEPVKVESKVTRFAVVAVQRDPDSKEVITKLTLEFDLPKDKEYDADLVVGTALDSIFSEMDLHKATKSKLFTAKLPLELAIQSEHVSMDLGKIARTALSVLKVNNGERSKLLFIDRLIAILNKAMQPMQQKRLSELRADMVVATQERYALTSAPKGIVAPSAINKIARAKFMEVSKEGELNEAEPVTAAN